MPLSKLEGNVLTIHGDEWARGDTSSLLDWFNHGGELKRQQCCLGVLCTGLGISDSEIEQEAAPSSLLTDEMLTKQSPLDFNPQLICLVDWGKSKLDDLGLTVQVDSPVGKQIIATNDDSAIDDVERCAQLKGLFKQLSPPIEVVFVGVPGVDGH